MIQLQVSLAHETGATLPYLQQVFDRLRQERDCSVQVTFHGWDVLWKELVNTAIYRRGADLSDAGSTWIAALVAMNALRPFARREIDQLGGAAFFLPSAWRNTSLVNDPQVWAIPFLADARVIYYWRDMLKQAGLDPQAAFRSAEQYEETFTRLHRVVATPWVDITDPNRHDMLYHAASWIWGKGGDFLSPDGKRVLVSEPAARAGLRAYFGLHRFMPTSGQPFDNVHAIERFFNRQTATLVSGPWLFSNMKKRGFAPEQLAQVGIALPPGPPFVGGTYLIVWQHTRHPSEAVELIRCLTKPQFQAEFCPAAGLLPVSQAAWTAEVFADQNYQILHQAMQRGRSFLNIPIWGMVEDKLAPVFGQIWADLFEQPDQDVEAVLVKRLDPAVQRLNATLAQ